MNECEHKQGLEEVWDHQQEVFESYNNGYANGFHNGWWKGRHESTTDKKAFWREWTATHWTKKYNDNGDPEYKEHRYLSCSNCGRRTVIKEKFCPACGFRMLSEEQCKVEGWGNRVSIEPSGVVYPEEISKSEMFKIPQWKKADFITRMSIIADNTNTIGEESSHIEADKLLCEILDYIELSDVKKEFDRVGKWYS